MSGLGDHSSRKYRARTGRPRDKKGDPQALMMLLLAFRNCIIAFSCQGGAAAEERKEASWTRAEEVGTSCWRRSQGATYWKWKKRHVTPHVGLQVAEARNEKRAKKKMELRQRRKEEAGAVNFSSKSKFRRRNVSIDFPGPGSMACSKREGQSTATKVPGEKVRCESSWRCDTLSKFDYDGHNACSIAGRQQRGASEEAAKDAGEGQTSTNLITLSPLKTVELNTTNRICLIIITLIGGEETADPHGERNGNMSYQSSPWQEVTNLLILLGQDPNNLKEACPKFECWRNFVRNVARKQKTRLRKPPSNKKQPRKKLKMVLSVYSLGSWLLLPTIV